MLNCSPKRISKRYEGNNYSKGRKFYVKNATKLDIIEARTKRAKLQALERRHKQKLLQLKIPHLLIANRSQDDQQEQGEMSEVESKKLPATNTSEPCVTSDLERGDVVVSMSSAVANRSIGGGEGLRSSNPMVGMDQRLVSNWAGLQEAVGPSIPSLLDTSRSLAPSTLQIDEVMNHIEDRPRDPSLFMQLRVQQAESQRLSRLLDLQRGLTNVADTLGQQRMRTSLLQRDLEPSSLIGDRLSLLLGTSHQSQENNASISYQLQELQRAEEARAAVRQGMTRAYAASLASADLVRHASSVRMPYLSSLAPSGISSQFNHASVSRADSLLQMHLQARHASSSTRRLDSLLGVAPRQEFKMNDEDRASVLTDRQQQYFNYMFAGAAPQANNNDDASHLLTGPTSLLGGSSSQLVNYASRSAQQQSNNSLSDVLRQLRPASSLAIGGTVARGQKRDNDETGGDDRSGLSSRRRLDDLGRSARFG